MKKIQKNAAAVAIVCSLAIASSLPATAGVISNESRFTSYSLSVELEDTTPVTGFAFAVSPRLAHLLLRVGLLR